MPPQRPPGAASRATALLQHPLPAAGALLLAATLWTCPFAALFGIPCPGCGLTRAAWALVCGEWRQALALHPLSPLLVPLVLGAGGVLLTGRVRAVPAREQRRAKEALLWLLCALSFGVWLARFGGAFGGPVPVQSLLERWSQ